MEGIRGSSTSGGHPRISRRRSAGLPAAVQPCPSSVVDPVPEPAGWAFHLLDLTGRVVVDAAVPLRANPARDSRSRPRSSNLRLTHVGVGLAATPVEPCTAAGSDRQDGRRRAATGAGRTGCRPCPAHGRVRARRAPPRRATRRHAAPSTTTPGSRRRPRTDRARPRPPPRALCAAWTPGGNPAGRKILVRVDGAGATHELLDWLAGQRLSYPVGFGSPRPWSTSSPPRPPVTGRPPTTPTANPAPGPGSSTQPG